MRLAIIQARMGSTRLPGKVLMDVAGRTVLARVVERTRRAEALDGVVVATTGSPADDVIAEVALASGWSVFRGSEEDVLDRYVGAARAHGASVVVRITSDCPLIDPEVVSAVVRRREETGADYSSNVLRRTFPRGLDVECMTVEALERAGREARAPEEREHVTPFIHRRPELFRLEHVVTQEDLSAHRWTVDTPEDLELVRRIHDDLGVDLSQGWREVAALLERRPDLVHVNAHVQQKT